MRVVSNHARIVRVLCSWIWALSTATLACLPKSPTPARQENSPAVQQPSVASRLNAAVVKGQMTDAAGAPVAEARIVITMQLLSSDDTCVGDPPLRWDTATDSSGRYRIRLQTAGPVRAGCLSITAIPPADRALPPKTVAHARVSFTQEASAQAVNEVEINLQLRN